MHECVYIFSLYIYTHIYIYMLICPGNAVALAMTELSLTLRFLMPGPQGCEKLHSPIGLFEFCARTIFVALRWLQNQIYYIFKQEGGAYQKTDEAQL